MSEGFEYVMEMKDGMSRPAAEIKSAMGAMRAEILKVKEASLAADMAGNTASMKAAATETKRLGLEYAHLAEELKHASEAEREAAKAKRETDKANKESFLGQLQSGLIGKVAAGELVAEGIRKIGEAASEAAHKVAEFVIETGKFAIEAAEFKESTVGAYEAIQGTAEKGEETYAEIEKLAKSMHMPSEKAQDIAKTLMEQGLENVDLVKGAIASISNLERAGLGGAADKFKAVIERSLSAGHFVMPKKLTGIQQESVYAELANELHTSVEQVKAEMKAGKIATETGISALEQVVNTGKIAEIAAKKFTLTDVVTDMHNSFRSMLQDVNVEPLMDSLREFVGIFGDGTASANAMKTGMVGALNEVIKWLGHMVEEGTIAFLEVELWVLKNKKSIVDMFESAKTVGGAFWDILKGIVEALGFVAKGVVKAGEGIGWLGDKLGLVDHGGRPMTPEEYEVAHAKQGVAPAHAEGGLVMSPAPGEVFASVAPGELILPREFMSKMPEFRAPAANGNGGHVIHVDVGGIEMHGVHDLEKMRPMLESEIADVFERVSLEMGR